MKGHRHEINSCRGMLTTDALPVDSVPIQRIREQIPSNRNPSHHDDMAIVSVDTLRNNRDARFYLETVYGAILVIHHGFASVDGKRSSA